jgi:hypothetical protein
MTYHSIPVIIPALAAFYLLAVYLLLLFAHRSQA